MLVCDPPTCRLSLSFKIFISIFTAFSHTRHTQSLFFLLKTVGSLHPSWKDQENTWGERGRDSMRIYLRCIIVMGMYTTCVHTSRVCTHIYYFFQLKELSLLKLHKIHIFIKNWEENISKRFASQVDKWKRYYIKVYKFILLNISSRVALLSLPK